MDEKIKITEIVAESFRAIGQPKIDDLIFVCESGSVFEKYDSIIGIPVYCVPFLNVCGGLLLASKNSDWNSIGIKLNQFQKEMEDNMMGFDND